MLLVEQPDELMVEQLDELAIEQPDEPVIEMRLELHEQVGSPMGWCCRAVEHRAGAGLDAEVTEQETQGNNEMEAEPQQCGIS